MTAVGSTRPDGPPTGPPPRDAATVVLLRDGADGLETCLLRRTSAAVFMPDARVFAGGSVDPEDVEAVGPAASVVSGIADGEASGLTGVATGGAAFWLTAVRESVEETGVSPGLCDERGDPAVPHDVEAWRARLHDGVGLAELLAAEGLRVAARGLRPFARWVTPPGAPRRFDTRFLLAAMPERQEVCHDGREIVAHDWVTPAEALRRHRRGEWTMILPTLRTLVLLGRHGDVASAMEGVDFGDPASAQHPEFVEGPDGSPLLWLPSDPERTGGVYDPSTGEVVASPSRPSPAGA